MGSPISLAAERLKQARETLQYSVHDVQAATGVPSERLAAIESGQEKPTGDEILILASLYNCDFRSFLDAKSPPPAQQTDVLFRRYGDSFRAEDRRAVQEFLFLCRIEDALEHLTEVRAHQFAFRPSGSFMKAHGQKAAESLRQLLGYAGNEVPRDVYHDFRSVGIHVFRRSLSNAEISGLYVNDPIAGHCVLVNYDDDIYRQRFSVAHEVAHAIFDSSEGVVLTYRQSSSRYDASDLKEIRANSFASNYLMPASMLKALPRLDDAGAAHWAQQFRVSTAALAKALKDAGLVDNETAVRIRSARVPKSSKIDPEAPENLSDTQRLRRLGLLQRGLSNHYVDLCFTAHDKGLVSTQRLAEMLRIDQVELADVGALYGRTIGRGV